MGFLYLHFTIFKTQVITTFQYNYYDDFSYVTTARHIASVYSLRNRSYTYLCAKLVKDILTYLDSLAKFVALYFIFDTICMWEAPISGSKRRLARGRTPKTPPQQY